MAKRKVNFSLSNDVHRCLKAIALLKGFSMSEMIEYMMKKEMQKYGDDIHFLMEKIKTE
jgi:hypothetical protein